jgi:hypothetical protein
MDFRLPSTISEKNEKTHKDTLSNFNVIERKEILVINKECM